jgi:L-arabinose isomerase
MKEIQPVIGLFGIGLSTYWPQFPGLEDRLKGYVKDIEKTIKGCGADVYNVGLVDTVDKAFAASHALRRADVDLIFLYATTYALSSTVLPVVQRAKVPVVVLNLQPTPAIDYATFNAMGDRTRMTGDWLAYCGPTPVPEIANVFTRAGIPFHQITGVLKGDDHVAREIAGWVEAARVAYVMQHNRMGLMGHYYNGMLDIYSDITLQCATFGGHAEIVEMDELAALRRTVTDAEREERLKLFYRDFDVQADCDRGEMARAAATSVALDKLVAGHKLGSMAYFYQSVPGHEHEDVISSVILGCSLLTARGIPIAGEYEIKNVQAMKIMSAMGVGGSFTEYCVVDYQDDVVLMGHDGPGHIQISEGKTKVRPLAVYHGKVGSGVSIEMSVKHGPVTLLSVIERRGKLALLVAEGESVPGPILQIGNTNSRYRFPLGARGFIEAWNAQGPAHHWAIGTGHVADRLKKVGDLVGIETIRVC